MSLFAELKRRNVFRVGIAYAVGSWLLVQAADLVLDVIGAESWVLQSLVALLALGFIPALIFAWAFELTPEGIKRESEVSHNRSITPVTGRKLDFVIIGLLAAAIGLLIFNKLTHPGGTVAGTAKPVPAQAQSQSPVPGTDSAGAGVPAKSIAVLPFANRSNQNDDLYFTDGIHDDLLTQLAKVGDLTVISRTSVMEYRDSPKNIKQIAGELNVAAVLEGGVQKVGNRVRINAQLIEAATDRHLWAETFDRELTAENIFELQSEIARKIVTAVAGQLTPEEERLLSEVPTQNLAAYEAYLRARDLFYGANYSRSQEAAAQPLLEKAIALDPDYAEAQVLLGSIYGQLYWRGVDTSDELLARYRSTLERAIELAPQSPLALRAKANYHYRVENNYRLSLEILQRALASAPGNVDIYGDLAFSQRRLGLWEESIANLKKALQLDPANRFYHSILLETMGSVGQWQAILDHTVSLSDADPDDLDSQVTRAWAQLELTGDLQPLEAVFQRMNLIGSTQYLSFSAHVHLMRRDADAAIAVLEGPIWTGLVEQGQSVVPYLEQSATAWRLKGDMARSRDLYEQLVARTEQVMSLALQDRFYGSLAIAHALARLERFDEATALMEQVEIDVPQGRDALLWGTFLERRAMVRALAGDEAGAIEDLEVALRTPAAFPTTAWQLHYHPDWDFFRENARFNELASPPILVHVGD